VSLVGALADRALEGVTAAEVERLRALTTCNLAAAGGQLGAMGELIAALPLDRERPEHAAFLYAMRLHARTQDDFYPAGRVHVGAVTLAVALALADDCGTRLAQCLGAGYEVMCAVSATYSGEAQVRGLRPTGVFGPLGAAASAAVALGLDRDGVANSIALAATLAGGTNAAWLAGSDEWLLEAGVAARLGVEAARFTLAGAHASPQALESRAGWARAFFGDDSARALASTLESAERGIEAVAVKPYPVSGIAQVPTHLACAASHCLGAEAELQRVRIRISEREAGYPGSANTGSFVSRSDALMSVVFCVTCGLLDGKVRLERLERPNEPRALELASRVQLLADPELEETHAVLELAVDGSEASSQASGAELLYPAWGRVAAATQEIAARSEASVQLVTAVRDELLSAEPDAVHLRALLDGEPLRGEASA
jgi:2-methylcitrate dehydratase PrpD